MSLYSYINTKNTPFQGLDGKIKINFQDAEALRILTKVLLKKDFDLDIDIPIDRLVPAVPLRLNYVLWLEDIIEVLEIPKDEIIYGIDIGMVIN